MLQFIKRGIPTAGRCGYLAETLAFTSKGSYSTSVRLSEKDVEEIRIPVPWGHIAGKWWGRKDGPVIVGIHGWQDNANTYDRLVPLLNVSNFLAIDLPGHGHSSHLPIGKIYNFLEYMLTIRRIVDHLKLEKYSLLGHSFGSALSFVYSSLYTEQVESFISIECARSLLLAFTVNLPDHLSQGVDKVLEVEKKMAEDSAPYYSFPEIMQSFITGSLGSINSTESALVLLPRSTSKYKASEVSIKKVNKKSDLKVFLDHELKDGDKSKSGGMSYEKLIDKLEKAKSQDIKDSGEYVYRFTKDPRIKYNWFGSFNVDLVMECSRHITCPVLSICGEEGFLKFASKTVYDKTNEIIKDKSKHFEHHEVQGNHHCHLNNPECVAPVVNKFLENIQ